MGGKLLSAIKSFYEEAYACVKINGETSDQKNYKNWSVFLIVYVKGEN